VGETALPALGGLALVVLIVAAAGVAGTLTGKAPAQLVQGSGWELAVEWASDTGGALAGLFLVGLAAFIAWAYRSVGARRVIGVLWDVGTFWPRAAHPFAPPCYAERVVPQLLTHVCGREEPVVLAGHSQGSVVAVATIAQLPEARRREVFLLTFGSQLARLYGRVFPCFFAPDKLRHVATLLTVDGQGDPDPRWRNLHRPTDPLGWEAGPLRHLSPIDVRIPDPDALAPSGGRIIDPPIRAHLDYHHSTVYLTERDAAVARLRAGSSVAPSPE
jgi:pimeloyl-ACP methyl ester carboxylesterase